MSGSWVDFARLRCTGRLDLRVSELKYIFAVFSRLISNMIFCERDPHNVFRWLCQLSLLAAFLLVGCSQQSPSVPESDVGFSNESSRKTVGKMPREMVVEHAIPLVASDPPTSLADVFSAYDPNDRTQLVAFFQEETADEAVGEATIDEAAGNSEAAESGAEPNESETLESESPKSADSESAPLVDEPSGDDHAEEPLTYNDWKKPELVFFFTGRQHGYIEPCGCTGLENAKGGLARRHTLLKQLREKFGEVPALDVGNQIRRFGRQAELKFQATVDSLETMKYSGVGFGPDDLRVGFGDLVSAVAGSEDTPFVCANVGLYDFVPTYQVVEVGKRRIGITAVLGDSYVANINNDEILESEQTGSAAAGLKKAMAAMKEEKCELFVLMAHATMDETRALVKKFPEIQIVVTAGGAGVPDQEPERIPGCFAYIIRTGEKGMFGGVVGVFMDRKQPVRYSRVKLSSRFEDSQPMLDRFLAYQNDLKQHGFDQLGVTPVPHPFDPARKYVGNEACVDCHEHAAEVFANSHHAHATESIIKPPNSRSAITRIHDPECVSCHVTGWDAQQYSPYESGYFDAAKSAHLQANGCENCHGPGSRHVAFENRELEVADKDFDRLEKAYQEEMRLTLADAKKSKCYSCHDIDNSPAFQEDGAFEEFWAQIDHNEEADNGDE